MSDLVNWDSFSHGQILSKKWLCEKLEPFLDSEQKIAILGGWYNVLAFMLRVRDNHQHITSFDFDDTCKKIADKINDCWVLEKTIHNVVADVNSLDLSEFQVIINTSCEHMPGHWFDTIGSGTIVCLQSSNLDISTHPWYITNPSTSIKSFIDKFPMTNVNFVDVLNIEYSNWGYQRFMIIGKK